MVGLDQTFHKHISEVTAQRKCGKPIIRCSLHHDIPLRPPHHRYSTSHIPSNTSEPQALNKWYSCQHRSIKSLISTNIQYFTAVTLQPKKQLKQKNETKLNLCEGGSFSTQSTDSDIQLSFHCCRVLYIYLFVALLNLKATHVENLHIVLSCPN